MEEFELNTENCEIENCLNEPVYLCGECKMVAYCSKQHQKDNWRVHRDTCQVMNSYRLHNQERNVQQERYALRKKYFQSLIHKIFDSCITIAEDLVRLEKSLIKTTRYFFNELEYGVSICLLARSFLKINNVGNASIIVNSYMKEKNHFLLDMEKIYFMGASKNERKTIQNLQFGENGMKIESMYVNDNLKGVPQIMKEFALKKASLLSCLANLLYMMKEPHKDLYQNYVNHIEKMFGSNSLEASNCYFMMGSYFMESKEYNKAIASYLHSAKLRGPLAGDCYYNLGIIFFLVNKNSLAVKMFEMAANLREQEFGENSFEIAEVYYNLAILNQAKKNYKVAIENYEKIALIYSKDKSCSEYKRTIDAIKSLQKDLKNHIELSLQDDMSKGDLLKALKDLKKNKNHDKNIGNLSINVEEFQKIQNENELRSLLQIPDVLLNQLNPRELYHLSELQLELQQCNSEFMVAKTVGCSKFMQVIKLDNLEELEKVNQKLFKYITLEKMARRDEIKAID